MRQLFQNDQALDLRLRRSGAWCDGESEIRHRRLCALLDRSIARDDAGKLIVTTGRDVVPFVSEDAPLRVTTASVRAGEVVLTIRDGRDLCLDAKHELCVDEEGRFRGRVPGPRGGVFWALWERNAAQCLFPLLCDEGEVVVVLPTRRLVVRTTVGDIDWTQ